MKSRLTLIFAALTVLLGAAVWVLNDQPHVTGVPAIAMEPVSATSPAAPPATAAAPAIAATVPAPAPPAATEAQGEPAPRVYLDASGGVRYVARAGDTVSQLALALLGSDSKASRDRVIAANPPLQASPDHVVAGQSYSVAPLSERPAKGDGADRLAEAAPAATAPGADAAREARLRTPAAEPTDGGANPETAGGAPKLEYTAQAGDTVRGLAADLLGGDTKANRDGIIAGNASLRRNPDHLVAGQSYTIVARNGMAADPDAPQAKPPTTQPEADEAARLSVGRMLGYKARPGDTVSKLAIILLGSDTPANRHLVVRSNFSLKQDPDRLVAGVTYWIPAPVADAKPSAE